MHKQEPSKSIQSKTSAPASKNKSKSYQFHSINIVKQDTLKSNYPATRKGSNWKYSAGVIYKLVSRNTWTKSE